MNTDFAISLSQTEFGYIWNLLNKEPATDSRQLMNKLEQQAGSQIQEYEQRQREVLAELETKAENDRKAAVKLAAQELVAEQAKLRPLGVEDGFVDPSPPKEVRPAEEPKISKT